MPLGCCQSNSSSGRQRLPRRGGALPRFGESLLVCGVLFVTRAVEVKRSCSSVFRWYRRYSIGSSSADGATRLNQVVSLRLARALSKDVAAGLQNRCPRWLRSGEIIRIRTASLAAPCGAGFVSPPAEPARQKGAARPGCRVNYLNRCRRHRIARPSVRRVEPISRPARTNARLAVRLECPGSDNLGLAAVVASSIANTRPLAFANG